MQTFTPFLVGTKFDEFSNSTEDHKKTTTATALKYGKAMKSPVIFCSASHGINVQKIFKIVLSKVFELKCTIPQVTSVGDPVISY